MSLSKLNPRNGILLLFIVLIVVLRLLHVGKVLVFLPNFTPIGAMALFGGTYFKNQWKSYLFPLLTLFASDVVMMQLIYKEYSNGLLYSGWYFTYAAFALMVLIGRFIKIVTAKNVLLAGIAAALSHWLITDFGVWLSGGLDIVTGKPLTHNFQGLLQCYLQGIPYIKNMLIGNLLYGGILYGSFELLQKRYPVLQVQLA